MYVFFLVNIVCCKLALFTVPPFKNQNPFFHILKWSALVTCFGQQNMAEETVGILSLGLKRFCILLFSFGTLQLSALAIWKMKNHMEQKQIFTAKTRDTQGNPKTSTTIQQLTTDR